MSDLSFVDRIKTFEPQRDWREHNRDVLREAFRRKVERIQNTCDEAVDYARDLMKAGGDIEDELKQLEQYGHSLVIVAALLRREAEKPSAACVQPQPERTEHGTL